MLASLFRPVLMHRARTACHHWWRIEFWIIQENSKRKCHDWISSESGSCSKTTNMSFIPENGHRRMQLMFKTDLSQQKLSLQFMWENQPAPQMKLFCFGGKITPSCCALISSYQNHLAPIISEQGVQTRCWKYHCGHLVIFWDLLKISVFLNHL